MSEQPTVQKTAGAMSEMKELLSEIAAATAGTDYIEHEVLAYAASEQEAQGIARAYGGALQSYDGELAVLKLEMTVAEAIELAADETAGLPPVYPNYIYTLQ